MTDRFISSAELSDAELNQVSGGRYSATYGAGYDVSASTTASPYREHLNATMSRPMRAEAPPPPNRPMSIKR